MRNKLANQKLKLQQQKRSESIYFYQMANANTNTIALFNLQTKQENDYSFLDNILLCQNKINAKIVSVIINTVHSIQRALVGSIQFLPIQETCKKCVGNREEEVNKTFPFCYSFSSLSLFVKHRLCFFCYVRTMTLCSSGFSAGSKHREQHNHAKLYFYGIFVLLRRERGRALLSPDSPERDLLRTGYYANSADISSTMVVVQLGVLVTLLSLNSKF